MEVLPVPWPLLGGGSSTALPKGKKDSNEKVYQVGIRALQIHVMHLDRSGPSFADFLRQHCYFAMKKVEIIAVDPDKSVPPKGDFAVFTFKTSGPRWGDTLRPKMDTILRHAKSTTPVLLVKIWRFLTAPPHLRE